MKLEKFQSLSREDLFSFYHRVLEILEDGVGNIDVEPGNKEDQLIQKFCQLDISLKLTTLHYLNSVILYGYVGFDIKEFDNFFADLPSTVRKNPIKSYCMDNDIHPVALIESEHRMNIKKYPGLGAKTAKSVLEYIEKKRC